MSDSSPLNTIARERVESLVSRNGEADWLKTARVSSWEEYLQTPAPTSKSEDWKRTEIDALDLSKLQAVDLTNGFGKEIKDPRVQGSIKPAWLEDALKHLEPKAGIVSDSLPALNVPITEELQKKGVIFCDLKTALKQHERLIRPCLERKHGKGVAKFALMNFAFFNSGFFLYVPKNLEIDQTFVAITSLGDSRSNVAAASQQGIAVFPRSIVVVEANSKVNLVNVLSSESVVQADDHAVLSLSNATTEIELKENANCNYLELQRYGENVFAVGRNDYELGKDAQLYALTVGLGGKQIKVDICTVLKESGARSNLQGIVFGDNSEHFSYNTIQDHDAPSTSSNINFKVALKGKATSIYQGTITVDKRAQKTDAYQSNKNLLLGSEARADSVPRLEILADDVKCSHGATVGPVDREQIFYLMSRGLTASEAEQLIVTGFFKQVLETCTISGVTAWLDTLITEKIFRDQLV